MASTLPMLCKAARAKELGSYSLGYLALANIRNGFYTVYVVSLSRWGRSGHCRRRRALRILPGQADE